MADIARMVLLGVVASECVDLCAGRLRADADSNGHPLAMPASHTSRP